MYKLIDDFGFGLFFYSAIILLIIIFLLGKFAWKPIVHALEAREEGIADALAAAENAKRELTNLKSDNEKLLKQARQERDGMLREARDLKEKIIADAKTEAQTQGELLISQAKSAIESEKIAAMAELKNHLAVISVDIAEKLLKSELSNKEAQSKLVSTLVEDIKLN